MEEEPRLNIDDVEARIIGMEKTNLINMIDGIVMVGSGLGSANDNLQWIICILKKAQSDTSLHRCFASSSIYSRVMGW